MPTRRAVPVADPACGSGRDPGPVAAHRPVPLGQALGSVTGGGAQDRGRDGLGELRLAGLRRSDGAPAATR